MNLDNLYLKDLVEIIDFKGCLCDLKAGGRRRTGGMAGRRADGRRRARAGGEASAGGRADWRDGGQAGRSWTPEGAGGHWWADGREQGGRADARRGAYEES